MIPIVEDYLSELLQSKLALLKANPNLVDKILGTSQSKLDKLKLFLSTGKPVSVIKGYPRDAAKLPAVVILLSSEEETQDGLGDTGVDEDVDIRSFTEELTVIFTEGGRLTLPYVETSYKPIAGVVEIIHNDIGTVIPDGLYGVHSDNLGLIGVYDGNVEHGDTLTVTYTYRALAEIQTVVMYEANYRLECWTDNGDLTVELYHLLKWALLSGRDHLGDDKDLFRQRTSGADFEPVPAYFPTFVYRRALNFWCQFTASTPMEEVPYITGVTLEQSVSFEPEP